MAGTTGRIGWKIVAAAFAVPTGIAVRKAIETGWRKTRNDDPPKNPAAPGTGWSEALVWAAVSGIAWSIARGEVRARTRHRVAGLGPRSSGA